MESLGSLPAFVAVAEEGGFAAAARRLGLTPSAIGKAVARLEGRLGVALFRRTTRRVALTVEGELLLDRARAIRDEWALAEAMLAESRGEPRGRLRIALPAIGYRLLAPHLARFAAMHPHVALDLDLDDRIVDLTQSRIDVAIRSGPLADSSYRSRKLGSFRFVLCAAPGYLRRHGTPATVAELARHQHVRFRHAGTEQLQAWRLAGDDTPSLPAPYLACTGMEGVLAATLAELGIAQMPDFLAAEPLASGRLVEVLATTATTDAFSLVWSASAQRSPKVRAFVDFATKRLL